MKDKDQLKNSLSIEQVADLVAELGGQPSLSGGGFIAKTICHNCNGQGSHKLYYYDNTHLFHCYTGCSQPSFDIYQLVQKVLQRQRSTNLPQSINYVASFFGYSIENNNDAIDRLEDWRVFDKYLTNTTEHKQNVGLKTFDKSLLQFYPQPHLPWESQGISYDILCRNGIKYDPVNMGIIIPHYDINGELVGIRERTLVKEKQQYGKYRPAYICGKLYNHPLGFNLYNINNSKQNIASIEKAVVFEGQKSCLQYASMFGAQNDISVACCGSSLINYQVELLRGCGAKEIIVAFDKQFQQIGDQQFKVWTKKLQNIHTKYNKFITISFLFDVDNNILNYKDSPTDRGKDAFMQLLKRRIML